MTQRHLSRILRLGLLLLIILSALFCWVSDQVKPGATTKKNVTANILVFEDTNGDGKQNNNEGPLSNALILGHTNIHGGFNRQSWFSNAEGKASLSVTYTHYFDVSVLPPCGYTSTTAPRLSAANTWPFRTLRFGFQAQSQAPPLGENSLHFSLWNDVNGDGQAQSDEPPLPDLRFVLIPPDAFNPDYGYDFDQDALALSSDESGQASLNMGSFCGEIRLQAPQGWRSTMNDSPKDALTNINTQTGHTTIAWGLQPENPSRTPTPSARLFEFSTNGAYHPDGLGAWKMTLDENSHFTAQHQVAAEIRAYPPVTLSTKEAQSLWSLIEAADIPSLPPDFQRLGIPDEIVYTFVLTQGNTAHIVNIWAEDAHQNAELDALVSQLESLRAGYVLPPTPSPKPTPNPEPVCELKQALNLRHWPVDTLAQFHFVDANMLALAGWGPRPKSTITPTATPTPTPGPSPTPKPTNTPNYGDFVTSPRHVYYQATLNLSHGITQPISSTLQARQNPCGDIPCQLEVLAQSPDGQWQLVHSWANGRGVEGAWLISAQEARHLGEPFVPTASQWQWAEDSTLLWYQRVGPGYGLTAENYVIKLESPPQVQTLTVDWDNPLDSNGYRPVFSPVDKTIYSLRRFETESRHFEWPETQLYHFDVTQSLPQSISVKTVPNLAQIFWNQADQQFWQVFITADGVELMALNSNKQHLIPFSFFADYMEAIATGSLELIDVIPQSKFAIDPQAEQIALNIRGKHIVLLACQMK